MGQRRSYTAEQKAEALALYAELGAVETARRTGIATGTLQSWAHRSGVATACTENRQANVRALKAKWAERRALMVDEIGAVAQAALTQTRVATADADGRLAKDFATTMAILVDKAQLLGGDVTQRHETVNGDSLDREIERLFEQADA